MARLNPFHSYQVLIDSFASYEKEFLRRKIVSKKHKIFFENIEKRRNFLFSTEEDRPVWGLRLCAIDLVLNISTRGVSSFGVVTCTCADRTDIQKWQQVFSIQSIFLSRRYPAQASLATIRKLMHRLFLRLRTRSGIFERARIVCPQQKDSTMYASFATTPTTTTTTATTMSHEINQHLELSEVEKICRDALSASGLNPVATAAVTEVVTTAERDGCHSHGLFRVPGYCKALLSGTVDGTSQPRVFDVAPGVVRVDAARGYAPPAILAGRDLAVRKARENGISCLAIHNSFHFAALWWEVEALANEGIVSLAFVNSRSFVAHQPGGKRKLYGTNPMAFGFPRAAALTTDNDDGGGGCNDENLTTDTKRGPLVWDQASAAMARGEIQLCQRDGHTLPEGVAIDRDGRPTTCPEAALVGFIVDVPKLNAYMFKILLSTQHCLTIKF